MAEITKPDLSALWASGGALVAPSNSKIQQGWTAEIPPHQWENFIQNRQDNALAYLYQMGIAQWDNATDYIADKSVVMHNGNIYTSRQNSQNVAPPNPTYWKLLLSLVTTTEHGLMSSQDKIKLNNLDTLLEEKADKDYPLITNALQRGNNLSELTNASAARDNLGLGTVVTRSVGTSNGQVPDFVSNGEGLGGFGYGRHGTAVGQYADVNDVPKRTGFYLLTDGHPNSTNNKAPLAGFYDTSILRATRQSTNDFVDLYLPYSQYSNGMVIAPHTSSGYATSRIVSDSVNLRTSTGNSTLYPMSQKAVTDALNTKADSTALVTELNKKADNTITISGGTGLSGGGDLTANRTLSVNYGTTAGTAAQGNDSRIVNAVQTAGTGLTKSGTTLSVNYGTTSTTAARGDDSRIVNAASKTELNDGLDTKVDKTTQVIAGTGLSGGGDLSSNRTLSVNYGTTANTAAQGNDERIVNSVQTSGNQTIAGVKTFSSFPVTPSTAPTTNYQAVNKKYVDDSAIGVGQTWQDMTSRRGLDTAYTNTTGRTIVVSILSYGEWEYAELLLFVDDVLVGASSSGASMKIGSQILAIVPPGSFYYAIEVEEESIEITDWVELR